MFVKNDKTEVVFSSKDESGNIICLKSIKADGVWSKTTDNKKGKSLLRMEEINVDVK